MTDSPFWWDRAVRDESEPVDTVWTDEHINRRVQDLAQPDLKVTVATKDVILLAQQIRSEVLAEHGIQVKVAPDPIPTPDQFNQAMKELVFNHGHDPEMVHSVGESMLIKLLRQLGYDYAMDTYDEAKKY
jgi:hypothetical protein